MLGICPDPACRLAVTRDDDHRTERVPVYGTTLFIHATCGVSLDEYVANLHHVDSERFDERIAALREAPDMAQRTIVQMTDDLDGSEATQSIVFGLDGQTYEIDLNDTNASDLREVLAPYVGAARKVQVQGSFKRTTVPGKGRAAGGAGGPDPKVVREWARANGYTVPERGRIPASITEAYEAGRPAPATLTEPEPQEAASEAQDAPQGDAPKVRKASGRKATPKAEKEVAEPAA